VQDKEGGGVSVNLPTINGPIVVNGGGGARV
jgi:hypothetical protein